MACNLDYTVVRGKDVVRANRGGQRLTFPKGQAHLPERTAGSERVFCYWYECLLWLVKFPTPQLPPIS